MSQKIYDRELMDEVAPVIRVPRPVLAASSAVLPARLFLGIVFLYAGIDKLTNPDFFNTAAPGYIGNQLAGFATISPIGGFLTSVAVPNAALFGWLTALGEVAIGLGTLVGLFSRAAALAGMVLSLTLWLSASWATDPFYLGSDLPYAMFFLVLAVGGPHPVLSLDGQLARWWAGRKAAEAGALQAEVEPVVTREEAAVVARRRFLAVTGATIAAGTFGVVAWGNALAERAKITSPSPTNSGQTSSESTPAVTGSATSATPAASSTTAAAAPGTTAAPAVTTAAVQGTVLTNLSALPSGTGKSFNTPDTNQPFLVIRGEGNTVHAFSAICTHQGCTVAFNQSANSIICPCHGAEYNPQTGAVTQGPAPRALAAINVEVDASGNVIYVTR